MGRNEDGGVGIASQNVASCASLTAYGSLKGKGKVRTLLRRLE